MSKHWCFGNESLMTGWYNNQNELWWKPSELDLYMNIYEDYIYLYYVFLELNKGLNILI